MMKSFRSSLLVRIVISQILFGIVPLLFLGVASMIQVNRTFKNTAIDFQSESIKQGRMYINLVMEDVESLIANLSGIDDIINALAVNSAESSYERLTTQAKIGYILSGYTNLKGLVSIDLFTMNGAHYHVGETLNATNVNEELLGTLFKETRASGGYVHWRGIEENINLDSAYPAVITATKILSLPSGGDGKTEGLLLISYDPAVFTEVFGMVAGRSGYTIILDSRNRIVFHPEARYIGHILAEDISVPIEAQKNGYFTQRVDGVDMLIVFDSTNKGDWNVVKFVPVNNIVAGANSRSAAFIVLITICVLLAVVHGVGMSRQFIQPIKKITDTFRLLKLGDFKNVSKLKNIHQDEIGELGNLFNSFIDAQEDITTQKKLERQLHEQNRELEEALRILKTAQNQMVQQEKMAGIGQLAAGVAHEINNPLGFVTANFAVLDKYVVRLENYFRIFDQYRYTEEFMLADYEHIKRAWDENAIDMTRSDLNEIISDTQEGLRRISEIVNALKTFSRTSITEEKTPFDLNEGIRTTLLIANNEIKYSSVIEYSPTPLPNIYANGGQINQVLLNIIVNAAHAIKQKFGSGKGLITIGTQVEDKYVCCYIGDNGCGMTVDVMNRIFEPFYTTKVVGQGTGLGLSLAYDIIVNKHGGRLEVTSEYGVGTCFRIMIPVNPIKDDEVE
jgi:signal transduction histidine kinase